MRTWCGRSPSARRTASRSGSKPWAASTSSTSAPRWRATWRSAKSSISRPLGGQQRADRRQRRRGVRRRARRARSARPAWSGGRRRPGARRGCAPRGAAGRRGRPWRRGRRPAAARRRARRRSPAAPPRSRARAGRRSGCRRRGGRPGTPAPRRRRPRSPGRGPTLDQRDRSTTGWSQSLRKPMGLKTRSSTGSGPGSVTTVGARSMTWCAATSPPRRATTTSGGTSRSASPAPDGSVSSTLRASRPGAAGRPAYDTTRPPWVVSPGPAAWRAISITTSWARAPEAKRTHRQHAAVAGLAGGEVDQPRPLRARHEHPRGGGVGEPAGDDLALPEEGYGARHPPQPRRGRRPRRARSPSP